ncbi:hypothetical protein [Rhodococcus sp. WAY2]|uniref:hypothetical protein n=1 Tax=Rhodococcus sp. WAY2 TaxID=2663121 RepID=UPI001356B11E|nr:hypothetical protein [Rhodococcus sp. WAY2]
MAVEFVEDLVEGGGRNPEVRAFRVSEHSMTLRRSCRSRSVETGGGPLLSVTDRLLLPRHAVSGDPMFGTAGSTIVEPAELLERQVPPRDQDAALH